MGFGFYTMNNRFMGGCCCNHIGGVFGFQPYFQYSNSLCFQLQNIFSPFRKYNNSNIFAFAPIQSHSMQNFYSPFDFYMNSSLGDIFGLSISHNRNENIENTASSGNNSSSKKDEAVSKKDSKESTEKPKEQKNAVVEKSKNSGVKVVTSTKNLFKKVFKKSTDVSDVSSQDNVTNSVKHNNSSNKSTKVYNGKTSQTGIDLITSTEACRLEAYKDAKGLWTIGYGHTGGVTQGMKITNKQAENYLREDLAKVEAAVLNTGLQLNQNQFDALVSFTYNCGSGNLKKLIANRSMEEIADAMLLYNKADGKVLPGLAKRREKERALFLSNA